MMLEISPQHHSVMEGPHAINLKTIMTQTGAQIVFPEANDPIIPILKKSSVTVSGNIDSVYLARQMLVVREPSRVLGCWRNVTLMTGLKRAFDVEGNVERV